jgi:hypothetical protein
MSVQLLKGIYIVEIFVKTRVTVAISLLGLGTLGVTTQVERNQQILLLRRPR